MASEIIMPQMGFDMKEGTLVRWLKKEGEAVRKGENIAEIETDKAVVEIEAFDSGVIAKQVVAEGVTVPVGQVIGYLGAPGEKVEVPAVAAPSTAPKAAPPPAPKPVAPAPAPAAVAAPARPAEPGERVKSSPLARKEAEDRGIDIAKVPGTGPGGRVTREDVIAHASQAAKAPPAALPAPASQPVAALPASATPPAPAPQAPKAGQPARGAFVPLSRMRHAIARNMSRSKTEIPHFYVTAAINMTEAMKLREQVNKLWEGQVKVSVNDLLVRGVAIAITKHTYFNSMFVEGGIQVHQHISVGIAVALPDGLVAPGIADTDQKSLAQIARESKGLVERARANKLTAQEFGAATFNITNLGMYNIESFSAIITPPQVAALAVGSVVKEPIVKDGQVAIADMMRVTLSIDHRVADGAQGADFLATLRTLMESPVSLLV
ncbi:MAG: 2-oxo acid dehydrogenase subunit E2 [Chloroflexi bacterium]|nr:2-oxo acid dehydrogenase subunit E2 [Chloroflexota bacterium]